MKRRIHSDPFSARIKTIKALWAISKNEAPAHDLKDIAVALDSVSLSFSSTAAAKSYSALAALMRIFDALVLWRTAVLDAEVDADRFLRSAQERFGLWSAECGEATAAKALAAAADGIPKISAISHVAPIARAVGMVPLPLGVFEQPVRPAWAASPGSTKQSDPEPVELTVAFLKFQIDGIPAAELHHVAPGEVHDLEIEVRVSRWPDDKHELRLTPVSVEPQLTYDFPSFGFERPSGDEPYILHQRGRAVLLLPQGMHARPFEFKYTAEFLPEKGDQPVAIVGHRTLIVDGEAAAKFLASGYPSLDRQLFALRDALRRRGGVPQEETADALLVLAPLCNLAGRAIQDSEFRGHWSEGDFQKHVRAELRRYPRIGTHLDEHAHGGGGITDLSLRGMPIELKVHDRLIQSIDDCKQFFAQAASYAVAKSKRTAILCVLDSSEKITPPISPETLLDIRVQPDSGVLICVLVVQGNLARPSDLSR